MIQAEPKKLAPAPFAPAVFVVAERAHSAASLYRAIGPFSALRNSHGVSLGMADRATWATLALHDILFLQRPSKPADLVIMEMARAQGRPVWVDFDDDLFALPTDNPMHGHFSRRETQKIIAQATAMAACVTVSTQALLERFGPLNDNTHVIPNAYNADQFGGLRTEPSKSKIVLWRGSATHERDLWAYAQPLREAIKTNPDWTFVFCGYNPWFITDGMPNVQIIPELDALDYFAFIKKLEPSIMIVPLHDSAFNRAKSNIAWLEATYAGAAALGPNLPEWKYSGIAKYGGEVLFPEALRSLMSDADARAACWGYSRDIVEEHLLLDDVNELRANVIGQLWGMRRNIDWQDWYRSDRIQQTVRDNEQGQAVQARATAGA